MNIEMLKNVKISNLMIYDKKRDGSLMIGFDGKPIKRVTFVGDDGNFYTGFDIDGFTKEWVDGLIVNIDVYDDVSRGGNFKRFKKPTKGNTMRGNNYALDVNEKIVKLEERISRLEKVIFKL